MNPLECYTSATSAYPGDPIDIHVYSEVGEFTVEIYRIGKDEELIDSYQSTAGAEVPDDDCYMTGCKWNAISPRFIVPDEARSGVHIVILTDTEGNTAEARFIIKGGPDSRSKILFQCAEATFQAYNFWGGKSLYGQLDIEGHFDWRISMRASQVSFNRPYIVDSDPSLNGFRYWELPLIQWLEENEYEVDYCTSIDLDADPGLLNKYNLLLSVGHDEYWSLGMKNTIEDFISGGKNVAFFGGNICWWQVRFDETYRIMTCFKYVADIDNLGLAEDGAATDDDTPDEGLTTIHWYDSRVGNPENNMTGVSFRYGGGIWGMPDDSKPRIPYTVEDETHWVFSGTGLELGQPFGKGNIHSNNIVGYETDSAWTIERDFVDDTPAGFVVLASADLHDWGLGNPDIGQAGMATMGIYSNANGGTVFTAGTLNWTRGLQSEEPNADRDKIAQITRNVLNRLGLGISPLE